MLNSIECKQFKTEGVLLFHNIYLSTGKISIPPEITQKIRVEHRMHKQAAAENCTRLEAARRALGGRRRRGRAAGALAAALGGPDKIYGHFPFKTILRAQLGFMSRRCCSDSIYSPIFHTITHTRITSDG